MKNSIGIDLRNHSKAISVAIAECSMQEVAMNPNLEAITFFYNSILFVPQIFIEEVDCLREMRRLFNKIFGVSNLRQISLVYRNEKLEEDKIIVWNK